MNKKINLLLIVIAIIGGIFYGILRILGNDLYGFLICISIIPVMLLPYLLQKFFHLSISPQIESMYLIFVFFAHFLGSIVNFYHIINGYDKIMHLISGMLSAFIGFYLLVKLHHYKKTQLLFTIIFVIGVTLSIASLWEFYEFISDNIFQKDAQNVLTTGVTDTMLDMLMAFIGASIVCMKYYFEVIRKKGTIVLNFIKEAGV